MVRNRPQRKIPWAVQEGSVQMRVNDDLYVKYNCIITYKGGTRNRTLEFNTVKVTREEYRLIIAGAAQGRSLEETEGIDDVLSRMKENVEFIDK